MTIPTINDKITLHIDAIGSQGEGIGRYQGYAIFVAGALPGEEVEICLTECHKRYARGQLLQVLTSSRSRVQPPCPLFGKCGGCQLMHLAGAQQLEIKRQRVVDAFKRIGNIDEVEVAPCESSPALLAYRNKIQLPIREGVKGLELGLYAVASHELVPIDTCHIHCAIGENVYGQVKSLIQHSGIKAYNSTSGQGVLRHLLIKSAVNTGEVLLILVTAPTDAGQLMPLAYQIMARCPQVKGVVHNINGLKDNVILGDEYHTLLGAGHIYERLGDLNFKVSPASFFQVNPAQAVKLYTKALEFAELSGSEVLLDAYCGVGTLALFLARYVKNVVGVECVPEAIEDARKNALMNNIENASFVCASTENFMRTLQAVDVVILNPPRKGCAPEVLQAIARLAPQKVIYVSCDPATLARDAAQLQCYGYRIAAVQPFDMFPQTAHVECVVKLCKRLERYD